MLIIIYFWYYRKYFQSSSIQIALIKILFTYVFLYGILEYIKVPVEFIKFPIDIIIFLIILGLLSHRPYIIPGLKWMVLFLAVFTLSFLLHNSEIYPSFTYLRTFLYPIIILISIINLKASERELFKLNRYIIILFILQVVASFYKLAFIGINEKKLIGTITIDGGAFSTMLSLFALSFVISFYFLDNNKRKYLILGAGFLFFSFMGAKRGIWIYFPVLVLISLYYYTNLKGSALKISVLRNYLFTIIGVIIVFLFGLRYSPTLNPEGQMGGEIDLEYFQNYAYDYTFNTSEYSDYSLGRGANTIKAIKHFILEDPVDFLFGYGPAISKGVPTYGFGIWGDIGIYGPVTGFTYNLIQIGFVGTLFILFTFFAITRFFYKYSKFEKNNYWKAIGFGGLLASIVAIMDYISYSSTFIATLFPISLSYFYVLGLIFKRKYRIKYISQ